MISDNRPDIFYSVFSTKISSHLSNPSYSNDKTNILSNIIHNVYDGKEKLINIYKLFLDRTKYTKSKINLNTAEILQFCLRFCLNADEISGDYDNIYYPLYCGDQNINSYIPGNDIKERKIYYIYSKIKKYLYEHPSSHGVYICACNLDKEKEETCIKFEEGNGYPAFKGVCSYCGLEIGNDGNKNSFYERDYYYRIFKDENDLEKESKNKVNGNCITLKTFFDKFISENLESDSKGINISKKRHFDNPEKPIRNQSQIGFRLMNLILYSHLFTNVLFNNKEEYFAAEKLTYLDYIVGNWNKLKLLLGKKIDIHIFMNLIYKDLLAYLNSLKTIEDYNKLLEVEKKIENIIENKLYKKTEKIKDKLYTKFEAFYLFYAKKKNEFREKDSDNKTTLIKQINPVKNYNDEKKYPYYKNILYSDYPDKNFYQEKLEEKSIEKYPVIDQFLNPNNTNNKQIKNFLYFNFVIKSLLNKYSGKINKKEAKKLSFEKTEIYKNNKKICDEFIKIINDKIKHNNLTKESMLENFLISRSTEIGKAYIEIYKDFAKNQNELLTEIIKKINAISYETLECQEINIQEAQKGDLLILYFENSNDFNEIFLTNTFREIYNESSKIKYENYNSYSVNFDKIEKILEDNFIKNACFLKLDEIIEMNYSGEDFLNDGLSEFNENKIKNKITGSLDEKDKKIFINYFEKNLANNLVSCLEINEGLRHIIAYANKNFKRIKYSKSLYDITNEGGFPYKISDNLKEFLKENINLTISKIDELIIYLEILYFDLALKNRKEFNEKIDDSTKNKIDEYYRAVSGRLITKEKLSLAIIKLLLNVLLNQKNKTELIDINDNLFEYLNNNYLWTKEIYSDGRFGKEMDGYKSLGINVKSAYDFYSYIANDFKDNFEKEKTDILEKIRKDEEEKLRKEKEEKREKERALIENTNASENKENNIPEVEDDDEDNDDMLDDL